ncbi:MAG: hypothetical protein ABSE49_27305 [Polyangiaceae bacterium]|jgi:hypothetical protein
MNFLKLFVVVGGVGAVVAASMLNLVACSSSSNGSVSYDAGGSKESGGGSSTSSGSSSGSSSGGSTSSSGGGEDGGASSSSGSDSGSCEDPPKVYSETTPGVYCPFSAADGGKNVYCAAGQQCCETPESANSPSTCVAGGATCPVTGSVVWECAGAVDCTAAGSAGPICCGGGSPTTETSCGMTWPEWTGFTGTKCATSCPAPGFVVCAQAADCTGDAGTSCTATEAEGNDFGYCTP